MNLGTFKSLVWVDAPKDINFSLTHLKRQPGNKPGPGPMYGTDAGLGPPRKMRQNGGAGRRRQHSRQRAALEINVTLRSRRWRGAWEGRRAGDVTAMREPLISG